MDALSSGGDDRHPHPRGRRSVVACLVLLVVGLGADRWQVSREAEALLACVERGESAAENGRGRVAGTVQYASPQLTAAGTSPRVRTSLEGLVRAAAGQADAPLTAARDACEAVTVAPWRAALADARSAYVVVLDRERERFAAIASDVDVLYRRDPELATLREQALVVMRRGLSGTRETRVAALLSP